MADIPHEALLFDLFYGGKGAGEETEEEIALRMNAAAPAVTEETPRFKNIYIQNVVAKNVQRAMYFNGLPERKIENIHLSNIRMTAEEGALLRQTNGLTAIDVQITARTGEPIVLAPTVENAIIR